MYIKVINGVAAEYTLNQLRVANPKTSFPRVMTDARYFEWGMYPLTVADKPSYDPKTQDITVGGITQVNGNWTRGWSVTDKEDSEVAVTVRRQRNEALSSSDWTQIGDNSLTKVEETEWATYRQSLRDIPTQSGFPFSVTWPIKD